MKGPEASMYVSGLQEFFWTRLTPGLSSLEQWLLCMPWALQVLRHWALASFRTMTTDSIISDKSKNSNFVNNLCVNDSSVQ